MSLFLEGCPCEEGRVAQHTETRRSNLLLTGDCFALWLATTGSALFRVYFPPFHRRSMNKGIWNGIAAYTMWGLFPIYWKLLHQVPALQVIGHRISWSFLLLIAVILLTRQWQQFRSAALTARTLGIYS